MAFKNPDQDTINTYLQQAKTIAVYGLSDKPDRTSYLVAEYLQKEGYQIIPVNPVLEGKEILGEYVYGQLSDVPVHIDIVDVFRRSEFLPDVAREFTQIDADVFWAQLGLENQEAGDILAEAGKNQVVMNRCTKIEVAKLSAR